MTNIDNRPQRSRALSDPKSHLALLDGASDPPQSQQSAPHHVASATQPNLSAENTIFSALTLVHPRVPNGKPPPVPNVTVQSGISRSKSDGVTHGRSQTSTSSASSRPTFPSKRPSPFFLEESKECDDDWKLPSSPLFDWCSQYFARPITSPTHVKPDPLYHELYPRTLPSSDPTMSPSTFISQKQAQMEEERRKVLAAANVVAGGQRRDSQNSPEMMLLGEPILGHVDDEQMEAMSPQTTPRMQSVTAPAFTILGLGISRAG